MTIFCKFVKLSYHCSCTQNKLPRICQEKRLAIRNLWKIASSNERSVWWMDYGNETWRGFELWEYYLLKRQKNEKSGWKSVHGEIVALVPGCGTLSSKVNVAIQLKPFKIYKYIIIFFLCSTSIVSLPSTFFIFYKMVAQLSESEKLMTLFDDLLKSRDVITTTEFVTKRTFVLF